MLVDIQQWYYLIHRWGNKGISPKGNVIIQLEFELTDSKPEVQHFGHHAMSIPHICIGEFPHGVMVKAMDCRIVVSEFKLQSGYYIHFRTNTLGKGMNLLILPAIG